MAERREMVAAADLAVKLRLAGAINGGRRSPISCQRPFRRDHLSLSMPCPGPKPSSDALFGHTPSTIPVSTASARRSTMCFTHHLGTVERERQTMWLLIELGMHLAAAGLTDETLIFYDRTELLRMYENISPLPVNFLRIHSTCHMNMP